MSKPRHKPRTGKDGKTRHPPRKPRPRQTDPVKDKIAAMADSGASSNAIGAHIGMDGRAIRHALERDEIREAGRQEAFAEIIGSVDFTKATAKQKLDAAIRAQMKQHERDYTRKFGEAVQAQIKHIMPTLQEERNKAFRTEQIYREFMDRQKKIFTTDQFKLILMCLHPDGERSQQKLTDAFRLFREKKFALTGEK